MKLRFLGTGTSTGNPEIGCRCEVCTSPDTKDHRLRASALVETEGRHILLDCGPDFRMQMLDVFRTHPIERLDAVLITHEHYDHVGGLDDLRIFSRDEAVNVYAESYVANRIQQRIPYVFKERKYPGVPNLNLCEIKNKPFLVEGIEIIPIRLMHGRLPVFGYRIGNLAYLTDLKIIPKNEYAKLENLDVLIINALRKEPHLSHETIDDALANIARIRPGKAFLIHMNHGFGLHEVMQKTLPENVFIAYDGLEIYV
ncbi:MAG: MBL fold metallo-hydrolase [Dysgonamonadaceae bacterium]|jgi:phosphoribosyl 1,2-cyclic phosphate phosphodiesterase|nr:MBL fold metallo-hydrolase [Dysgonamonadaceae bacterium]